MAAEEFQNVIDEIVSCKIEPGASAETMLVTTNSYEEYEEEINVHRDNKQVNDGSSITIEKIQEDVTINNSRINSSTHTVQLDQVSTLDYSDVVTKSFLIL